MRSHMFERTTANHQLMRIMIDVYVIEIDNDVVAHFFKGYAFCFGQELRIDVSGDRAGVGDGDGKAHGESYEEM